MSVMEGNSDILAEKLKKRNGSNATAGKEL